MKLLQQARRSFLRAAALGLLLGGALLYLPLRFIIQHEYDAELLELRPGIDAYLDGFETVPPASYILTTLVEAHPDAGVDLGLAQFTDTLAYDPYDEEDEPYRKLSYATTIRGERYRVELSILNVEAENLVTLIFVICLGLSLTVLAFVGIETRRGARSLWTPFRSTLDQLKAYRVGRTAPPELAPSRIEEFDELNGVVNELTAKLEADYRRMREFTGNASHELQTPIAIISGQLDLLIQSEHLDVPARGAIAEIGHAVRRLRSLHRSLLQLTRIEGDQFAGTELIRIDECVHAKLAQFGLEIEGLGLGVTLDLGQVTLELNADLLTLLLHNLVGNAVKHNRAGGRIAVALTPAGLRVGNTGSARALDVEHVFDRFYQGDPSSRNAGLGLGLAIAREICERQGLRVAYGQRGDWHDVHVAFPSAPGPTTPAPPAFAKT